MCGWPTRRAPSVRTRHRRAIFAIDKLIDAATTHRRRRRASRLRISGGEPGVCRRLREAGLTFIGPSGDAMRALGSKTAAREIASRAGVPIVPGSNAPFSPARERPRMPTSPPRRQVRRISAARESGRGRRRQGDALRARMPRISRLRWNGALRSRGIVRRRSGVFRAMHREAAAHRSAAAGRSPRDGCAVRRARMLDPAASSEADRGDAVAGGDAGAAGAADGGGGGDRTCGRLHQRWNDRISGRCHPASSISWR